MNYLALTIAELESQLSSLITYRRNSSNTSSANQLESKIAELEKHLKVRRGY